MADTDLSAEGIGRLRPDQVVDLLDGLASDDPALAGLDVDAVGAAVDPRRLNRDGFVRLLAAFDRLAREGTGVDLSRMGANTFARLITRASGDQVQGMLVRPDLRRRVLDEVFRRMGDHLRADRAATVRAVIHWRLTGGVGEGGYDRYESIIEDGTCVAHEGRTRDPRATITLHPADFLRLITRNASGPVLFMTGKLKIRGDLGFAAGLTGLFDLPKG